MSRDSRHFESPSPPPPRALIFSLSAATVGYNIIIHIHKCAHNTHKHTLISQWDLVSSCNSYLYVRWSNNIIYRGWVFILYTFTIVCVRCYVYRPYSHGGVCARRVHYIMRTLWKESRLQKSGGPRLILPEKCYLFFYFHYYLYFFPI